VSTSTVSVYGARATLREGQVRLAEDYAHETNYYIGGQTGRSLDVAHSLIDRLMGEYACADRPSICASFRFGNCIHVRVHRLVPDPIWLSW